MVPLAKTSLMGLGAPNQNNHKSLELLQVKVLSIVTLACSIFCLASYHSFVKINNYSGREIHANVNAGYSLVELLQEIDEREAKHEE